MCTSVIYIYMNYKLLILILYEMNIFSCVTGWVRSRSLESPYPAAGGGPREIRGASCHCHCQIGGGVAGCRWERTVNIHYHTKITRVFFFERLFHILSAMNNYITNKSKLKTKRVKIFQWLFIIDTIYNNENTYLF